MLRQLLLLCVISLNSFSQSSYTIDGKFLKSVDGKYFAFSYYDEEKEKPYGLMFQLKYEDSSFIIKNLLALSKWDGTSYKGTTLTLKEIDTTYLIFEGQLQAKYRDGDTRSVDCELKFYLYSTKDKYETWLYLPPLLPDNRSNVH